jgi:hypothetical protein
MLKKLTFKTVVIDKMTQAAGARYSCFSLLSLSYVVYLSDSSLRAVHLLTY